VWNSNHAGWLGITISSMKSVTSYFDVKIDSCACCDKWWVMIDDFARGGGEILLEEPYVREKKLTLNCLRLLAKRRGQRLWEVLYFSYIYIVWLFNFSINWFELTTEIKIIFFFFLYVCYFIQNHQKYKLNICYFKI
jgi:hypothetical protein